MSSTTTYGRARVRQACAGRPRAGRRRRPSRRRSSGVGDVPGARRRRRTGRAGPDAQGRHRPGRRDGAPLEPGTTRSRCGARRTGDRPLPRAIVEGARGLVQRRRLRHRRRQLDRRDRRAASATISVWQAGPGAHRPLPARHRHRRRADTVDDLARALAPRPARTPHRGRSPSTATADSPSRSPSRPTATAPPARTPGYYAVARRADGYSTQVQDHHRRGQPPVGPRRRRHPSSSWSPPTPASRTSSPRTCWPSRTPSRSGRPGPDAPSPASTATLDGHLAASLATVTDAGGTAPAVSSWVRLPRTRCWRAGSVTGYGDTTVHYTLEPGVGIWQPVPPGRGHARPVAGVSAAGWCCRRPIHGGRAGPGHLPALRRRLRRGQDPRRHRRLGHRTHPGPDGHGAVLQRQLRDDGRRRRRSATSRPAAEDLSLRRHVAAVRPDPRGDDRQRDPGVAAQARRRLLAPRRGRRRRRGRWQSRDRATLRVGTAADHPALLRLRQRARVADRHQRSR